jgi:serine/threonine-protein kinase
MTMNTTTQRKVSDLGKYRLVAELARGGMGVVYLAAAKGPGGFNKLLVVKELRAHFAEDRHAVQMFLDEAKLSARLGHPNVVQTYEVGSQDDRHYIAMEYLEGETLHRIVKYSARARAALGGAAPADPARGARGAPLRPRAGGL